MKHLQLVFVTILSALVLLSCNSESPQKEKLKQNQDIQKNKKPESDLSIYELSGKVKKCVETEYLAMEKDGKVMPEDSTIQDQYVYEFNRKGQLIKDQSIFEGVPNSSFMYQYDKEGRLLQKKERNVQENQFEVVEYVYNEKGELTKAQRKNSYGDVLEYTTYEYNSHGDLLLAESYESSQYLGTDSFVYNDKGWLMEEHQLDDSEHIYYTYEYNSDGLKTHIYYHEKDQPRLLLETFRYDPQGRLSFHQSYDPADSNSASHSYSYHANGQPSEEQFEQFNGTEPLLKIIQKFNEQGLPIEEVSATVVQGEKVADHLKIEYVFDEQQNWIRQVVYENGQSSWLILREIEYFKN